MRTTQDIAAIILIGDGVVGALTPAQHVRRYEYGPTWWRAAMRWFVERPRLTRGLALLETALGVMLALHLARR